MLNGAVILALECQGIDARLPLMRSSVSISTVRKSLTRRLISAGHPS